jgi:hypothetical protein
MKSCKRVINGRGEKEEMRAVTFRQEAIAIKGLAADWDAEAGKACTVQYLRNVQLIVAPSDSYIARCYPHSES